MRPSTCAGTLYPASESELRTAIKSLYTGERGPGELPTKKKDRRIVAAIAPHDAYPLSGEAAAWVYHALAASPLPELVIILGANHLGTESGTSLESWQTPLGFVRTDQAFLKSLVAKGTMPINEVVIKHDTSIEPQLPLLQSLYGEGTLRIAPLVVGSDLDFRQLALDLKETLVESQGSALVIVSSNFIHHGPKYRHVRFSRDAGPQLAELDKQLFALIEQRKPDEFLDLVEKELLQVCGADAIATLLAFLKPATMRLEQYYQSTEVSNDQKNSVSYAAIVFEK